MPFIAGTEFLLRDRVLERTQTSGTGAYALDGAATSLGRQGFLATIGNGNPTTYTAQRGSTWERGIGTVSAGAPPTLSRDRILGTSADDSLDADPINWPTTDEKDIFIDLPSELANLIPRPGQILFGGTATGPNTMAITVPATIPAYFDGMQVWWRKDAAANTGNITLNVNEIGAVALLKAIGPVQIPPGEAAAHAIMGAIYIAAASSFVVIAGLKRLGATKGTTQVYTSNNTWTKPAGLNFIEVEMVGGGGSGAGAGAASHAGGGAGGGQYAWARIDAGSLGSTVAVTIGSGGAAPSAGNNAGNNGATTSFGAHVTAAGGSGAPVFTSGTSAGGVGGTGGSIATGAGYLIAGSPGDNGTPQTDTRPAAGAGGRGGGPLGGGGGRGASDLSNASGFAGQLYGGGGGGAGYGTAAGGGGASGILLVHEFYS